MREETRQKPDPTCVFCKQPITQKQRPAVLMPSGEVAHVDCWAKRANEAEKPKPN